jgi:hypothetical protein
MKTSQKKREAKNWEVGQTFLSLTIRVAQRQRDEFLRCALAGDWAPLAVHIRRGGRITPQMRPFLADVLVGRKIRPRVKISRWATKLRNGEVVSFIRMARERGEKEKRYSEEAEKKFGLTWRHLQKILAKEKPDGEAEVNAFFDRAESILQKGVLTPTGLVWKEGALPASVIKDRLSGIRYRLSDMALSPHTLA